MVNPQRQKRAQQNPNQFIPEELLEVSQEFWQEQYSQPEQQVQTPSHYRQQVSAPLNQQPVQQVRNQVTTSTQFKPMEPQNTFETVKLVPQTPGELRNLAKQAELTKKLQKLQNKSGSFEEELADGARAAGQTGRIVVENANPFTGPVRAYSYLSIILTSAGLLVLALHIFGVIGSKVASNVKVQVKYGEQPAQTAPSRLTTGRGNPPVVDWVPGGR